LKLQDAKQVDQNQTKIERPQRWDQPLDSAMSDQAGAMVLRREPFSSMDAAAFSSKIPLAGVLKNDCRIHELEKSDIIVREGDYGSSAFLILDGSALVSLKPLPDSLLGRESASQQTKWMDFLTSAWSRSKHAEVRDVGQGSADLVGRRDVDGRAQLFLHDIPRIIPPEASVELKTGEIFGELSALTRSPRSATVVANSKMQLLEIRWQGFRELLKRHPALKLHVEQLYRDNSLRSHLREIEAFAAVSPDALDTIWESTKFEPFGDFQWDREYTSTSRQDIAERIKAEPLIAEEGDEIDGLILIRSGFARLSRRHGQGHQTIAYLGKGQSFGLRELVHNFRTGEQRPWLLSLRAVGHVDLLRIPSAVVNEHVIPVLPEHLTPSPLPDRSTETAGKNRRLESREPSVDTATLEFLVDKRLINGSNAMMIDLNRCTRCDDCVRACASTHDNNPRFNRSGVVHENWMIAHACMHCLDPVCMIGCPTGAIGRDSETGAVKINDATCIGCSTCANSCPYQNIQMVGINNRQGLPIIDSATGDPIHKATKCDLCQDHGGGPACVRACPHDALVRIDLSTPGQLTQIQ
jgi:Fe-S-cluster-containing dehydrogenase component/CRP-like cAMP-binding protein